MKQFVLGSHNTLLIQIKNTIIWLKGKSRKYKKSLRKIPRKKFQ